MTKNVERNKPETAIVVFTPIEIKALRLLIEERLRKNDNMIKDIKGLCILHDKVEKAEIKFKVVPF